MRSTKASAVAFAFLGIGLSANCAQPPAASYEDLVTLNEEFLEFRVATQSEKSQQNHKYGG